MKTTTMRTFNTLLILALISLILSASSISSLQLMRPVMAAGLTSVKVVPASSTINQKTTYDIFLKTATTGTIKTIQMDFPSSFNLAVATKLIERSGIGSGSLSVTGLTLKYTVSNPVSVSAGTDIRLEIGRIIATKASSSFTVGIKTLNTGGGVIDGTTQSGYFTIKSITGNDISPNFIIKKTLLDDSAGNTHGWNPGGSAKIFGIIDGDISGPANNIFVSAIDDGGAGCRATHFNAEENLMSIVCDVPPANDIALQYLITKLPANVVRSTSISSQSVLSSSMDSSMPSSPFDSLEVGK